MSGSALVEIRDVIHVWIEFRAPRKGDLMWSVPDCATPAEALEHVVVGRDAVDAGEFGFGYRTNRDMPEFALVDEGDNLGELRYRNIVVHVDHVRTEPDLSNVIPHVKLL